MAGFGREGKALLPMRYVANLFKDQTLAQLQNNLMTQRIWPYEVYPGYHVDNERRRLEGGWYSTGEGSKSFEGEVISAGEDGIVTLAFRYNDYLQYVDIGVGGKTSAEDVDRSKNVHFKSRYISRWDRSKGSSSRPGIMPEFRHLQTRIMNYLVDFYGYEGEVDVINTFDGLNIKVLGF